MDEDAATRRRLWGGPRGRPRAAGAVAELQRSRSAGSLLREGGPGRCAAEPSAEPESEDQGRDLRSDIEDSSCQADPEEDKQEKNQDPLGKLDPEGGKTGPAMTRSHPEEQELKSIKLDDPLGKEKPSVFVEIDLEDHAEEVVTGAMREEKQFQMDMENLSEDETRTSWVCCIPYSTRRKAKDSV